jgi:hypothetical protein
MKERKGKGADVGKERGRKDEDNIIDGGKKEREERR